MRDPSEFYRLTKDQPPWPLLIRAAALVVREEAGVARALDLGCGAGRDTRYLLANGFDVTAVDENAEALEYVRALPSDLPAERLHLVQSNFVDFPFTAYAPFDLISAQFSLPFTRPEAFGPMFARLTAAIRPGGIFAGQFFGVNDQWNREGRPHTFVTRAQAEALLRDLEVVELVEEDADGHVANGNPKHWHVFHILARRPQGVRRGPGRASSGDGRRRRIPAHRGFSAPPARTAGRRAAAHWIARTSPTGSAGACEHHAGARAIAREP